MKGICVILFGVVLAVIFCSQQAEGGGGGMMDLMSMDGKDIRKLAAQYKMADCWNFVENKYFNGEYKITKVLPLMPKLNEIVMEVAQEPKCKSAITKLSSMMG